MPARRLLSAATVVVAASLGAILPSGCGSEAERSGAGSAPASATGPSDPIRRQRDSKVALIKEDMRRLKEKRLQRRAEVVKTGKPDSLLGYLRKEVEKGEHESKRIGLQLDELLGYLDQNREFEAPLEFAGTRAWAGEVRTSEEARVKRLDAALAGVKDISVKVDSAKADWQGSGIKATAGAILGHEAKGEWTVGLLAGRCGPKGLAGEQYEAHSIYKHPHGSLLLRVGEAGEVRMAGEAGIVEVTEEGGLVSARCNDKSSADNKGTIELRVVLLPPTE